MKHLKFLILPLMVFGLVSCQQGNKEEKIE